MREAACSTPFEAIRRDREEGIRDEQTKEEEELTNKNIVNILYEP